MDILEIAKNAFKIAQASDNIELQRQILEIQEQEMALQQKNYGSIPKPVDMTPCGMEI